MASYFHPSHLAVDPAGANGGAAGGAVTVFAIAPALDFTLKVRAGAEGAAAPVPAFAFAFKAVGGVGDAGGAVATGAVALGVTPSHLKVAPDFGAEGRAVNVPDVALAFTLGAAAGFGSSSHIASQLKVDPAGADGSVTDGAVGALGAGVLLNKLDAFEVYSLTFSLKGTLLIYPLTLSPMFLNIEGFGALEVLVALALAALRL